MNGRSAFPVLTLRQASFDKLRTGQGERTGKALFDKPPSLGSGQAGRTDWKDILRQDSFARLRTGQGEWIEKEVSENPKRLKMA
ncbi:MAG: hypothetical protein LBD67_01895 [Candidatus Accumulibacter sp.]|nr:hypothetical protein [Accumulibacter sp.]